MNDFHPWSEICWTRNLEKEVLRASKSTIDYMSTPKPLKGLIKTVKITFFLTSNSQSNPE